jgi:hypothetical protein
MTATFRPVSRLLPLIACAAMMVCPPARAAGAVAAEVAMDGDVWRARIGAAAVYDGPSMVAAIQAAVDGLTPGRDRKETVRITGSGTFSHEDAGRLIAVRVPSFTVLDFTDQTIHVRAGGGKTITPVRAENAESIEIRNLRVTGSPGFAVFIKGCEDVTLSNLRLSLGKTSDNPQAGGGGIRSEGGDRPWSGRWNKRWVLEDIHVENTRGHGVELWRTDGLTAGTIRTRDTGHAGVLLNQTRNARIELVDALRANPGGGYAGFRTANDAGPGIEVGKVIAIECGRGVFSVSGSHGIVIEEVEIARSSSHGMLIEDTQDFTVNGGTITGCGAEGVRIGSRASARHHPAARVTVRGLRVTGCAWGVRETLPRTNHNRILNNDLRGNARCLGFQGEGTVAEGNRCE